MTSAGVGRPRNLEQNVLQVYNGLDFVSQVCMRFIYKNTQRFAPLKERMGSHFIPSVIELPASRRSGSEFKRYRQSRPHSSATVVLAQQLTIYVPSTIHFMGALQRIEAWKGQVTRRRNENCRHLPDLSTALSSSIELAPCELQIRRISTINW